MNLTILILYLATEPEPALAYRDPAECWAAVDRLRTEFDMMAECRSAQIVTPVWTAPMTSPRPLPKPEGLK